MKLEQRTVNNQPREQPMTPSEAEANFRAAANPSATIPNQGNEEERQEPERPRPPAYIQRVLGRAIRFGSRETPGAPQRESGTELRLT